MNSAPQARFLRPDFFLGARHNLAHCESTGSETTRSVLLSRRIFREPLHLISNLKFIRPHFAFAPPKRCHPERSRGICM
jgi:hypothetical protein